MKKAVLTILALLVFAIGFLAFKYFSYEQKELTAGKLPYNENSTTDIEIDTVEHAKRECEAGALVLLNEKNFTGKTVTISHTDYQNLIMSGVCMGKMNTFLMLRGSALHICAPETMTAGEGVAIFLKWANDNPDKANYIYPAGFLEAFHEAFPCPN